MCQLLYSAKEQYEQIEKLNNYSMKNSKVLISMSEKKSLDMDYKTKMP